MSHGGLAHLLSNHGDLVVSQSLFIEPVRTGDFLEGINRRLNPFRPGNGDEFDVSVDVANRKDAAPARLKVWIDCDAAILVESQFEPFEGLFRGEKSDLHNRDIGLQTLSISQLAMNSAIDQLC